ncbi:MAG: hypothetical protein GXP19_09100 [Gammaproteobacteria bacterium]|nr:hypothetical protein [Gammaproteobacteria bacterium]
MEILGSIKPDVDWTYFKKAITVLTISCVITLGLASGSYIYVDKNRRLNNDSEEQLNKLKANYQKAVDLLQLINKYSHGYQRLEQQGFVGEESRLDWIETLRKITEKRRMSPIAYNIKAQKPYMPSYEINTNFFQINSSEIVLKMKLLHERDLLDIFMELNKQTPGVYAIKKCDLSMGSEKIIYEASAVNIYAECTLNWFTIQPVEEV